MQFDADTVGSSSPGADAEMCMMAADTMEALSIPRGSYVVKVWNRKLLDGVMSAVPELASASSEKRLIVLRSIDKLDRLGIKGVQELLSEGRKDESGDVTRGAHLSISANNFITSSSSINAMSGSTSTFIWQDSAFEREIKEFESGNRQPFSFDGYRKFIEGYLEGRPIPQEVNAGLEELERMSQLIGAAAYGDRIRIDQSVVRGLEYYTGPVFEVELTFATDGKDGSPRFGSVGGGGRYDGLVSRFRGEPVPATGFSIGVSRLAAALEYLGKLDSKPGYGPVVVTVFDRDRLADYQNMVAKLRAANIRSELYLGNPKNLGNQLKYADRRNSPCVVIQGSDEKAKGNVTIKDLIVGAELAKLEKGRDEHLQKQSQAQVTVDESELVATVGALLARHGVGK
jgi:histidyl-tRNA synthetase